MSYTPNQKITAPWDEEQVDALNAYQASGAMHPFTCGNRPHPGNAEAVLVATPEGWVCRDCDYTQDWAHAFMADPETLELLRHTWTTGPDEMTVYHTREELLADLGLADGFHTGDLAP
jgi:hypothetical protein